MISISRDKRGFDTEQYEGCSVNELRSIWENKLLDMKFFIYQIKLYIYKEMLGMELMIYKKNI